MVKYLYYDNASKTLYKSVNHIKVNHNKWTYFQNSHMQLILQTVYTEMYLVKQHGMICCARPQSMRGDN